MIVLKRYMEIWYFMCIRLDVTNMELLPSAKKKSKMIFSHKNSLKGIEVLDIHSRKSFNNSLYFYGYLYMVFIYCFPEKKPGNLIYRIEVLLLLQFIWLEIFYNEKSSILSTIQPSGVVFRGVLERQSTNLFVH